MTDRVQSTEVCFACGRATGTTPRLADTRDDQIVYVGIQCWAEIQRAGDAGYQPPRGGPKLYPVKTGS